MTPKFIQKIVNTFHRFTFYHMRLVVFVFVVIKLYHLVLCFDQVINFSYQMTRKLGQRDWVIYSNCVCFLCVALDDIMDEETQLLFDTLLPVAEARLKAEALARGSHQKQ